MLRYALAFVSVACALLLGLTFVHFGLPNPFTGFALSAIALTFWQGGTSPGVVAVLLAIIVRNTLFASVVPPLSRAPLDVVYIVFGALMIWLRQRRRHLDEIVADRTAKLTEAIADLRTEIAERKRAQEDLRHSQEELRDVLASIPDYLWSANIDKQGQVTYRYYSPVVQKITGRPPEFYMAGPERWLGIIHPEDLPRLQAALATVTKGEVSFVSEEYRIILPDESIRWVRDSVQLRRQNEIIRTDGVVSDITERKQAEEELRLTQFSVEHASDSIFWADSNGRILYANLAACRSLESSREELFSLTISDIDPLLTREAWEAHWEELKTEGSMTFESQNESKDGRVFPVEVTSNYLEFNGREYCFAFVHDITERRKAEGELQRSFDQLRSLAARLESIREEERKRLSREIHDQLGQALTAIKIDLGSLMRELPAEKEQASNRAVAILGLVDETIRSVRRISTELRPGMLDDLGLVATVEWTAEEFGSRTGIKCRLDFAGEEMAIDPERATAIFRILQEMLTNVARHSGASEVEVRLAREDGHLTLEVQDNGRGIPQEKLSSGKSLGILGMRERATLFGGELTISAFPGNGTLVRVRIPEVARTRRKPIYDQGPDR